MMSTTNNNPPGPYLDLAGIRSEDLPPKTITREKLTPYLTSLLRDAIAKIEPISSPQWEELTTKRRPGSDAPIKLFRQHPESPARTADWFARESTHLNVENTRGTASWEEFCAHLQNRDRNSEPEFTPRLREVRLVWDWRLRCDGVAITHQYQTWGEFKLELLEVRHSFRGLCLRDRIFPILRMTCALLPDVNQFIVVTVPVSGFANQQGAMMCKLRPKAVVGAYASVERLRRTTGGAERGRLDAQVEWIVAAVGDAKGVIRLVPRRVQKYLMPKELAKDVPAFFKWLAGRRGDPPGAAVTGTAIKPE